MPVVNKTQELALRDAAQLRKAIEAVVSQVALTNKGVKVEVSVKITPAEPNLNDWYSLAETYLLSRTRAKDYRGLSIELLAMENVGLHRRTFAPTVQMLANTLTTILGWSVASRSLSQRMDDLDTYKYETQIQQSENFWRGKLN